ncbi:histone H3.v1-like [Salvia divinorum]|uniref:Histone H3.v1-like n=1 Tax=Salvia divinorum TaxID=28513 RepID=A0ABD1G7F7_SALDI
MFEKKLTSSDVERNQNRLLISGCVSDLMASLTEEERGRVELNGGRDYLRVVTRETSNGVDYTLHLKRWAGSGALVLKHEWGKLVRANGLQMGDSVVGLGYRVDAEFRLFLTIFKNH